MIRGAETFKKTVRFGAVELLQLVVSSVDLVLRSYLMACEMNRSYLITCPLRMPTTVVC